MQRHRSVKTILCTLACSDCSVYSQLTQSLPAVKKTSKHIYIPKPLRGVTPQNILTKLQFVLISGAVTLLGAKIKHPCCSMSRKQQLYQDSPFLSKNISKNISKIFANVDEYIRHFLSHGVWTLNSFPQKKPFKAPL